MTIVDDLLIFGATEEEHDSAVKHTHGVLRQYGILLIDHKCKFKQREIIFLGHKLSADGISASEDKVKSVVACKLVEHHERRKNYGAFWGWLHTCLGSFQT